MSPHVLRDRSQRRRAVVGAGPAGLAAALHDGYDLGCKLGWVLRGWPAASLLDSYEAERRPVAEYIAARSADPRGSIRPPEREVRADISNRIAHMIGATAPACAAQDDVEPLLWSPAPPASSA
jgi:2-polyprenyl-6-methoxyphenol hydroxylase-like FAD-dependent oxidoreductase